MCPALGDAAPGVVAVYESGGVVTLAKYEDEAFDALERTSGEGRGELERGRRIRWSPNILR